MVLGGKARPFTSGPYSGPKFYLVLTNFVVCDFLYGS